MSRARCIQVIFISCLLVVCSGSKAQPPGSDPKRFEKDGLIFDYTPNWELSDQSNAAAQQLVLTEKTLDAQIMIIALRGTITKDKEEDQAKAALIEPSITRLLKQYQDAAIQVERTPAKTEIAGSTAEGVQLRFAVDGQPGATDIYWRVINQRLVQLFFIRQEKTVAKSVECWDSIRGSLKVEKSTAKNKDAK